MAGAYQRNARRGRRAVQRRPSAWWSPADWNGGDLSVHECEEPPTWPIIQDQPVQPVEHGRDPESLAGQDTHCVPRETGDRRGLGPGATHVADGETPAVIRRGEDVIEVAPDLVSLTCRRVLDREVHTRNTRHLGWQQAALQGPARLDLLRIQPRVVECESGPPAEILHHLDRLTGKPLPPGTADHKCAKDAAAGHERAAPHGVGGKVGGVRRNRWLWG